MSTFTLHAALLIDHVFRSEEEENFYFYKPVEFLKSNMLDTDGNEEMNLSQSVLLFICIF